MTLDTDELPKTFTLNNGVQIPTIGLGESTSASFLHVLGEAFSSSLALTRSLARSIGTWQAPLNVTREAVAYALQQGYRHLDCAYIYLNEREVGEGIAASGVPREEVFVTSKVWNLFQDDVAGNLEKTLDNLGLDYVDLYVSCFDWGQYTPRAPR